MVSARLFLCSVLLPLAGCGEAEHGFVPVRGVVLLEGKPLATGFVSYRPDPAKGNASLHVPTGIISAEGRYELFTIGEPGAPPGWYRVLVFADQNQIQGAVHPLPPQWMTNVKYTREETTDLSVCVAADAAADAYHLSLAK